MIFMLDEALKMEWKDFVYVFVVLKFLVYCYSGSLHFILIIHDNLGES